MTQTTFHDGDYMELKSINIMKKSFRYLFFSYFFFSHHPHCQAHCKYLNAVIYCTCRSSIFGLGCGWCGVGWGVVRGQHITYLEEVDVTIGVAEAKHVLSFGVLRYSLDDTVFC